MIPTLIGFALPIAAVWLALRAWDLRRAVRSGLLALAVSFGVGIGLSALTTTWAVFLGLPLGRVFVGLDALLWIALATAAWIRLRAASSAPSMLPAPSSNVTALCWVTRAAFLLVAVFAVAASLAEYSALPHGQWDAFAIWNQKARFLLRGGRGWTSSLEIAFSNPGHPLLLPASVARLWAYSGTETTFAPGLLSFSFGAAIVASVIGALGVNRARAWIAGAVLLAPEDYLKQVMSQMADVPLGFFIMGTLVVLRKDHVPDWLNAAEARAMLLLAGLLVGFGAWTKNEGIVFLAIAALLVAWTIFRHGRLRDVAWFAVGLAPGILTVLYFKLVIAPGTPVYVAQQEGSPGILALVLGPERHAVVWPLLWQGLVLWGGPLARGVVPVAILAAFAAALAPGGRSARGVCAVTFLMLAAYYLVYIITPLDIVMMVNTSFGRLLAQLWPALVLTAFFASPIPRRRTPTAS